MPHTQFDIQQLAEYLHLSEEALRDLVKCREIPFHSRGEETVFIREEVDSWASQRILQFQKKPLQEYHRRSSVKVHSVEAADLLMPELIQECCIQAELPSRTRASLLKDLTRLADDTGRVVYPEELERSILERETLASTAMAGGFALVHPRYHDPYMFEDSFIALARSGSGLPFGAPDGFKTDLFFVICCQSDRIHLHVLARLSMMCNHTDLLPHLRAADDAKGMLDAIYSAEEEVVSYL